MKNKYPDSSIEERRNIMYNVRGERIGRKSMKIRNGMKKLSVMKIMKELKERKRSKKSKRKGALCLAVLCALLSVGCGSRDPETVRVGSEIARCEIEFLIVGGIVRDMHLAVLSGYRAIFLKYNRCVVVEPGGTAFEKRGDKHHAASPGHFGIEIRGLSRYRYGKIEVVYALHLAEIQ